MSYIDPTPDALQKVVADAETSDQPIRMINLLRFRTQADYGDQPDPLGEGASSTGAEAYARYAEIALAEIAAAGGSSFYSAASHQTVIGPEDEDWDLVAIIEYPSRSAFLEMVAKPSYQAAVFHRTAGLADTRLIMTTGFR